MKLTVHPKRAGVEVTIDPKKVIAIEKALSGMTWIIHIRDLAPIAVNPTKELKEFGKSKGFVELPGTRAIREDAIVGVFFASPKKDVIRIALEDARQPFDLFPGKGKLDDAYNDFLRACERDDLPLFIELEAMPQR